MTDQPIDPAVDERPVRSGSNAAILLALGETRAAATQAAETGRRVETAVGNLAVRTGALEVDMAAVKAQLNARDQAERLRVESEGPKTGLATWISLAFTALLALYVILDHTPSP